MELRHQLQMYLKRWLNRRCSSRIRPYFSSQAEFPHSSPFARFMEAQPSPTPFSQPLPSTGS